MLDDHCILDGSWLKLCPWPREAVERNFKVFCNEVTFQRRCETSILKMLRCVKKFGDHVRQGLRTYMYIMFSSREPTRNPTKAILPISSLGGWIGVFGIPIGAHCLVGNRHFLEPGSHRNAEVTAASANKATTCRVALPLSSLCAETIILSNLALTSIGEKIGWHLRFKIFHLGSSA